MFRRFSLFDSSPPSARISINPPKLNKGKSSLKGAIINTLQVESAPASILFNPRETKRSKSLDQSAHFRLLQSQSTATTKQRTKSATLPPIINRQLPQASPTSHRWYSRLGNSFRRNTWRRPTVQYQVM